VRSSSREANIIGFKVLVNCDGVIITEMSGISESDLSKVFKGIELSTLRSIVRLANQKLEGIHEFLEAELSALNHQSP
jgi:hypothetical protein|tara:strand:+ start:443 stop:676 length:234 start_codon:yes stop_codon:yes gene_type:complete